MLHVHITIVARDVDIDFNARYDVKKIKMKHIRELSLIRAFMKLAIDCE